VTQPYVKRGFDWEAAGRKLGETLGSYCAIVVVGADPVITGRVAVGVARGQSSFRRVAVGDLFAESEPIHDLVQIDDLHGLVDSFLYGVSLSRITHEVRGAGQLFVMRSGTEAPDYEEILPNPRWHRLTAGFREIGALLVLAAPAAAPRLEALVAATDGIVLVADAAPGLVPLGRVIATVREPAAVAPPVSASGARPPNVLPGSSSWSRRQRMAAAAGGTIAMLLVGVSAWLAYRPLAKSTRPTIVATPDTAAGLSKMLPATGPDTAIRDSGGDSAVAPIGVAQAVNPEDSAVAAAFAVELMAAHTQSDAILQLQRNRRDLPAATFAPVLIQGVRSFEVIGGAYTTYPEADSLLLALRRRHVLRSDEGSVVRLPYAFRIEDSLPAAAVAGMLSMYADRGEPVYALRQSNGRTWLLVGAFASPEQASLFAESLRGPGPPPVLVYRKGRVF
jgi:hypothetical protein